MELPYDDRGLPGLMPGGGINGHARRYGVAIVGFGWLDRPSLGGLYASRFIVYRVSVFGEVQGCRVCRVYITLNSCSNVTCKGLLAL